MSCRARQRAPASSGELRDERVSLELATTGPGSPASSTRCCRSGSASSTAAAESGEGPRRRRAPGSSSSRSRRTSRATLRRDARARRVCCAAATSRLRPRPRSRTSTLCWPGTSVPDSRLTVAGDPRSLPASGRALGVPHRRAPGERAGRPAGRPPSRSGCASTTTPWRSASRDRSTGLPTSRPRWPEPGNAPKFLGGSLDVKVSRGHANAVAQLPVPG